MIKLTITEKGGEPRALSFDQDEVSIGRVQGNDIVLPKGNISKRHSKLSLSDGRMTVSDAKSTNGTYVNGRKIAEPTPVRPGDKIFVGDFLIVIDPAAAAAETSGLRRGPPPPPPPPPRPGTPARPIASLALEGDAEEGGMGGGFGDLGDSPPSTGRGRPPAPPPPPPLRRTIVTTSLQDDRADIGLDDAPPSPADIGAGGDDLAGDVLANLGNDLDASHTGGGGDAGSDVFGSRAADDEDADLVGTPMPSSRSSMSAPAPSPGNARPASAAHASPRPSASDGRGGAEGSIETLLADPTVTAIVIAGGTSVEVERGGKLEPAGSVGDANTIAETVWQIANTAVPPPAADNPVVDVRLVDGTRVTALFPPITAGTVSATLRKSTVPEVTLAEIAGSADVEKIITAAVTSRRNLLLCGDGPACAALAGALAGVFPADRRVVSIGAGTKSRPGWIELGPGHDLPALVRAAVAFRADHLLVADAGGIELPELLLATARGQEGVVGTMAARSAYEALARLRAFSVGAIGAAGFAALVASSIDLIVLAATTPGGAVRVVEMAEPQADGEVLLPVFVARRSERNRGAGIDISGVSTRLATAISVVTDGLPPHLIHR